MNLSDYYHEHSVQVECTTIVRMQKVQTNP